MVNYSWQWWIKAAIYWSWRRIRWHNTHGTIRIDLWLNKWRAILCLGFHWLLNYMNFDNLEGSSWLNVKSWASHMIVIYKIPLKLVGIWIHLCCLFCRFVFQQRTETSQDEWGTRKVRYIWLPHIQLQHRLWLALLPIQESFCSRILLYQQFHCNTTYALVSLAFYSRVPKI